MFIPNFVPLLVFLGMALSTILLMYFVIHYCKTTSCLSFGHFPTARILTIFVVQNCLSMHGNVVVPNREKVNDKHYNIEFENYAMARKVYCIV